MSQNQLKEQLDVQGDLLGYSDQGREFSQASDHQSFQSSLDECRNYWGDDEEVITSARAVFPP